MRFKPGQEVVCIVNNRGKWKNAATGEIVIGPKYNEVVTVRCQAGNCWIVLKEYRFFQNKELTFLEMFFEPLISDEKLEEELQGISEAITVKRQMPY